MENKKSMRDRIIDREYVSKLYERSHPGVTPEQMREIRREEREDQRRLNDKFKTDLLEDLGLTGHPKADEFYRIAWEERHSGGFIEVYEFAEDLAGLLK